jgi:glutathione synthase/RimK-type ligase-like ATP-grasp enzyme
VGPNEAHRPSNEEALQRFVQAAPLVGLEAELIGPDALERLPEFDGLFNRASPEGVIYEFVQRAEALGMPVVDDPESILKCGKSARPMAGRPSRRQLPSARANSTRSRGRSRATS